ncbi:DUF2905 domain-containing protein [Ekhidna lutea]|uniref:DUF2905 domain-containing protein n=1 Tax=Ekhidna lutea TaxID=447679 RepID=UPI001C86B6C5|nr:DUF2905 domain-containing protein [Ekhidna lutea]
MGKILILIGLVLVVIGAILEFAPNIPLGRLPGDIRIEKENFTFYFPITTCIVISLLLMLVGYLWNKVR